MAAAQSGSVRLSWHATEIADRAHDQADLNREAEVTVHNPLRVVIAYDGSPSAATAVRAAASLFPAAQAYLVTVPPQVAMPAQTTFPGMPPTSPDAVQQVFDQLLAEARRQADETAQEAVGQAQGLGLQAEVVAVSPSDRPWAALLDAAHRLGADVLACGTRGRGAFARAVLGSTSSRLLDEADLPLLVVPDGGGALDGPVVAAYDGSHGAARAIQVAGRLMNGRRAVVVHAWEPVFHQILRTRTLAGEPIEDMAGIVAGHRDALANSAAATVQDGVAAARDAGLDAVGDAVESDGGTWRAIATAARAHRASVIAIGSRGLGAVRSVLLGSVSSGLVQNAELPILVVPQEPAAAG